MLIAAVGVVLSIIGIFMVSTHEGAKMKQLMASLNRGINFSAVLTAVFAYIILYFLGMEAWWQIGSAVVSGLLVGIIIGKSTEYYTSHSYKPTIHLAESGKTGPGTVIINGIGLGMISTAIPFVQLCSESLLRIFLLQTLIFPILAWDFTGLVLLRSACFQP